MIPRSVRILRPYGDIHCGSFIRVVELDRAVVDFESGYVRGCVRSEVQVYVAQVRYARRSIIHGNVSVCRVGVSGRFHSGEVGPREYLYR